MAPSGNDRPLHPQTGSERKEAFGSRRLTSFAEINDLHKSPAMQAPVSISPNANQKRNEALYYLPRDVSTRFGKRLKMMRIERDLTQLQMAVNFGIDRTFISDLERGRKSASLRILEVFALGLNVSLSELLKDL